MPPTADRISFSDFKDRLRVHFDQSRASGRPLYVTSDGKPEAVVLSPEAFETLVQQAELAESLTMLDQSMADVAAGRITPAKTAIRQMAAELNITIDR